MRFQKAIKRIVAMGTGALMLSSAYAAADLANYPAPYVKSGSFSGVLVVGDKAAAEDVIGITDIISSLQAASVKPAGSGGSSTVSVEGGWKVGTSNRVLELSENLDSGTNREAIANITSLNFIDDEELPGLLAKGSTSNSKGTAEYDQRLYFEDPTTGYVIYTENDDSVTGDFLFFGNGKQVAKYEMEFTTQLESDVDDSAGSASTTGTFLTDLEDVEVVMMGKTFQIVTAKRGTSSGGGVILTMMGGAVRDTLLEGNTKTYTVDGRDYEVSLNYVDADEGQFVINGQTTRKLKDGDTDKLSDGTTVGVSDILYQDYAGGIHSATFFIGAQKIELRDTDVEVAAGSSNDLKVDDETIDDAHVIVEATDDNTTFKLDKIILNISADDDFYVPANGKLSEVMAESGSEPEALFTKNWDVEYQGLSDVTVAEISIKASGSDDYNLVFNDGRGNQAKLPLINAPGGAVVKFGDNDDDLIMRENRTISKDDYFVVTDESDSNGERQSFALRYRGADKSTKDNPLLKFDDLGSGERLERPVSVGTAHATSIWTNDMGTNNLTAISQMGEIKLGGASFKVYNASSHLLDDFRIFVDLDASGTVNDELTNINTKEGAAIDVVNDSALGALVTISTPSADDYDDLAPTNVVVELNASAGEVRLSDRSALNLRSPEDDDDNSYGYTSMGAFVKLHSPTNDPQDLVIDYPTEQRVPIVLVTGEGTTVTTSAPTTGPVTVQRINVGAAKLASEVSDVRAQNTILVGGPCANAAAATVMGNPADCTAGFEPGVGLIQLWEHSNGNVAMLVAGYSAVDTRNAAQVVANYAEYKNQLKGTKVEVRKVNNQLTVAQPAAPVVAPAAPAAGAMEDNGTA